MDSRSEDPAPRGGPDFPGIGGSFALVGIFLLFSILLLIPVYGISAALGAGTPSTLVWIGVEGGMALSILWGWRRTGLPFLEVFPLRRVPVRLLVPGALAIPGILLIEEKLIALQFRVVPPPDEMVDLLNADAFENGLVAVIVGLLLAPLLEELLFRGLMFRGLRIRNGLTVAFVVTSVLFSVLHVIPYLLIPFTLYGLLLAWVTWSSGSLVPAIFLHVVNNCLALAEDVGWLPRATEDLVITREWAGPAWTDVALWGAVLTGAVLWARNILNRRDPEGTAGA